MIQPLVIVFSCVSVYVWRERSENVELSFQDNDLYFRLRKESYLCSEDIEGPSASSHQQYETGTVLLPLSELPTVISKHSCQFELVPVWSSRSPWSRVSQSDQPGSGTCVSPGTGSYWGWSADAAPTHTKTHVYTSVLVRTLIDIIHSLAPDLNHHNYMPKPYPNFNLGLPLTLKQSLNLWTVLWRSEGRTKCPPVSNMD